MKCLVHPLLSVLALAALGCAAQKAHAQAYIFEDTGILSPTPNQTFVANAQGSCPVNVTTGSLTSVTLTVYGPASGTFDYSMSIAAYKGTGSKALGIAWSPSSVQTSKSDSVLIIAGAIQRYDYPYEGNLSGIATYSAAQGTSSYGAKAIATAHGSFPGVEAHPAKQGTVTYTIEPAP